MQGLLFLFRFLVLFAEYRRLKVSHENTTVCHVLCFVPCTVLSHLDHGCHEQGRNYYQEHHKPDFFCSSLVKSEPRWLRPEKLRLERGVGGGETLLVSVFLTGCHSLFSSLCGELSEPVSSSPPPPPPLTRRKGTNLSCESHISHHNHIFSLVYWL